MRRRIPSIISMLCFEAGARTGVFNQAAEELNLSQSAVSRQVKLLEEYVGQQLFTRERQRVHLTPAGRRLLSELKPQLDGLESTILQIQSYDREDGALNVGVYPTFGSRWLMPKLTEFGAEHPELVINTITYLSNEEFDPKLVDIAIVQGDPPWPGFNADLLMPEDLTVVCSPQLVSDEIGDPQALLSYRILQHSTRPLSWPIWFQAVGEPLERPPTGPLFSQFEMLIEALIRGHGIAIMPTILIDSELASGRLVRAHPFVARSPSSYFLLTPHYKVSTPKIERFRRWLLDSELNQPPTHEH